MCEHWRKGHNHVLLHTDTFLSLFYRNVPFYSRDHKGKKRRTLDILYLFDHNPHKNTAKFLIRTRLSAN